jgi:TfoX/Sxy family transcriptional regulator of competence genes
MQIPKPTAADMERFRSAVPDDPRVEVKPMFGNLGAFVNGNMFMGLFGAQIGLKLPEEARAELLAVDGAGPFGPPDRPMGGYVRLPAAWVADPALADPWVERARAHVAAQPAKGGRGQAARG